MLFRSIPQSQPKNSLQDPQKEPQHNTEQTQRLPARFQQNLTNISIFLQNKAFENTLPLFADSQRKELNGLLKKGVFKVINISDIPQGVRIFNS